MAAEELSMEKLIKFLKVSILIPTAIISFILFADIVTSFMSSSLIISTIIDQCSNYKIGADDAN